MPDAESLQKAADAIAAADALLIGAGAGMGVDSGLPDFRGAQGFWKAYPAYARLGLRFEALANPHWFENDPTLAWGFYGHRLNLYRATQPHAGFQILRKWAGRMRHGAFVFTSNVDGQFSAPASLPGGSWKSMVPSTGYNARANAVRASSRLRQVRLRWTRRPCAPVSRYRRAPPAGRWPGPTS